MKTTKLLLSMALLALTFSVSATVITVSNNPDSPGQYTSLQAAIDAANPTDTIYVAGSQTTYGTVNISKQLVLIGAGYNPDNQYGNKTTLGHIYLTNSLASNSVISGFYLTSIYQNADNVNNITISRNYGQVTVGINSSRNADNWLIYNNILNSVSGGDYASNIYIENNIFVYQWVSSFSQNTIYISNNVFTKGDNTTAFSNVENAIITNNIIYGMNTTGCNFCTFNNNLSSGGNVMDFNYDSNSASNNIVDQSPQFSDVTLRGENFDYSHDYHLEITSPGYQAGLDGKDLGIYGGNYPFPSGGDQPWQTSAMPAIPQVDTVIITNAVVPAGGTLSVEIKGRSNQ